MSKKKMKIKIQREEGVSIDRSPAEKKPAHRFIVKDLLASLTLFFPAFFIILLSAELMKFLYEPNMYNVVFPALLALIGLSSIVYTCISAWITKMPYLVLPNYFFIFLLIVIGKFYLGHSVSYIIIASIIGVGAYLILSLFIKKDLWVKWIPESILRYLPSILGAQLAVFGLILSGLIKRTPAADPIKNFALDLRAGNAYFPLYMDTWVTPTVVLLCIGLCVYFYLKHQNNSYALLWSMGTVFLLGFVFPGEWNQISRSGMMSAFRSFPIDYQPYRLEMFKMIFSNLFVENGFLNWSYWTNFFNIVKTNFALLRFSMMVFFFMVFYSVFMHQSIQQAFQKIHPDADRKDLPESTYHRFHGFTAFLGLFSANTVFSYTEHSIFSFFAKGKTFYTPLFVSLGILLALLLAPLMGYYTNPALMAMIWIILGVQLIELTFRNISLKQLQDYFIFIPMLLIAVTTMNLVESLMGGILIYSLIDVISNYKNRKQAFPVASLIWILIIVIYYLFKVNAF